MRGLERDGLVSRHVTPTIPPRVDYELTELGSSLREPVKALGDWAIEHIDCIRGRAAAIRRDPGRLIAGDVIAGMTRDGEAAIARPC